MAPEAKVFIKWRMLDGRAMPVQASVSYAEGARMFDSGEAPTAWRCRPKSTPGWRDYLREHYEPPVRRGKEYKQRKQGDHAD